MIDNKVRETRWMIVVGVCACLLSILFPFFPDEKLIRLKLQVLELSVIALGIAAVLKIIWTGVVPSLKRAWMFWAVTAWVLTQIFLYFLAVEKSLAAQELRRVFLAGGAFFAFYLVDFDPVWRRRFLLSWSLAAGLIALYGILQRTGGVGPIMVPQMDRVMSTFGNPIFLAAYLVPSLFATAGAFSGGRNAKIETLLIVSAILQLVCLYLTGTRAAWIALFVVGVAFLLRQGLRKIPQMIVLGGLAAAAVFALMTKDVWMRDQGHLLIWRDTLRMTADHPVKGVGLGALHVNFPQYAQEDLKSKWPQGQFIVNYAHNEYLQTLAEGGLIGFLPLLGILLALARRAYRRRDALSFGALAVFVQNFFSVDMRFGISAATAFLMMGISASEEFPPEPRRIRWKLELSLLFLVLMGALVLPRIFRPYQAQRAVEAAPAFFDERLLDPAKTIEDLEKLSQKYPDEPAVWERLAFVYSKEIKSPDQKISAEMVSKALAAYEKVSELDPKRVSAYNNRANIYYTIGQVDPAIAHWRKAVAVKPDFLDAHLNLGKVLYVRGDLKESAAHFETVLRYDPNNAEAVVYLKRMVE